MIKHRQSIDTSLKQAITKIIRAEYPNVKYKMAGNE